MLRVMMLADRLGPRSGEIDGSTTYVLQTAPALVDAGVELTVCFMAGYHPAGRALEAQGIAPIFLGRGKYDPRALWDVDRLVAEREIRLLHLSGLKSHLLGRLAALRHGCRTLLHMHDSMPLGWPISSLQRSVAAATDLAIAVSTPLAEWCAEHYRLSEAKVLAVQNGVDLARYAEPSPGAKARLCAELGIDPRAPLIGTIGRLTPMKGHEYGIRAMPVVRRRVPAAVLVISGTGYLRPELERLTEELGITAAVRFAGFRHDFLELLSALDVVAMPSMFGEGLPYATVEAIATGTPVVAFPIMGIPEVVLDGHTGLLAPTGDHRALGAQLARLLTDPELYARLSAGGRAHARSFSIERHVARLVTLYHALLAAAPTQAPALVEAELLAPLAHQPPT